MTAGTAELVRHLAKLTDQMLKATEQEAWQEVEQIQQKRQQMLQELSQRPSRSFSENDQRVMLILKSKEQAYKESLAFHLEKQRQSISKTKQSQRAVKAYRQQD